MNPDPLIESVASGAIGEEQLSWQDYQQVVSHVIKQQNLGTHASSEVTISDNEHSGEIDIVIRYISSGIRIGGDSSGRDETIFVECKRRGRKLELDDVGKVFCYSIIHQPRALYIVSPFPLAPQAIACAGRLFSVNGFPPGFFRQTAVLHRTLKELLASAVTRNVDGGARAVRLESWSVVLEDVFHSEVVADETFCSPVIEVPSGATVTVGFAISHAGQIGASARLSANGKLIGPVVNVPVAESALLEIRLETPDAPVTVDGIEISARNGDFVKFCSLPRLEFVPASAVSVFGDLRQREAIELADKLATQTAPRVVGIVGEAGVGKSYFCESVARRLKATHDFSCFQIVITPHDEGSIFFSLLKHLFIPVLGRQERTSSFRSTSGLKTEVSILSTAIAVAAGNIQAAPTLSSLFSRIFSGRRESADLVILLDAIVTAIRSSPHRHLIVLRDCHLMSEEVAALLRMLFARFQSEGWGGARFLLEYRKEGGQHVHSSWNRANEEILNELGSGFPSFTVEPLTFEQLVERVCPHIEAPSPQLTAEVLLRQAGGNPLFLEHVIRELLHSKVLVRDDSGGKSYRVDHFDLFKRRIETLPTGLDALLRHRVESIVHRAGQDLRGVMAAYLGLASVISTSIGHYSGLDEASIAKAIGCKEELLPRVRHRLVAEAVMRGSLTHPPAEFIHDLMAAAALAGVKQDAHFRDAALAYCNTLPVDSVGNTVIGGRLSTLLGRPDQAVVFFESGLGIGERRGHFLEQRRCLEGIRDVLEEARGLDPVSASRRLRVSLKLIWNELQQGSQFVAERFIEQTRKQLKTLSTPQVIKAGIHRLVECEVLRYQVILDMRQANVPRFAQHVQQYVEISDSPTDLHYAATRLTLMSLHLCLPGLAWEAAQLAIGFLGPQTSAATLSSLYSDLGHFFLIEQPASTEILWRKALQVLEGQPGNEIDERQRAHTNVNVSVVSAMLRPNEIDLDLIARQCQDLAERGLTNPLLRLQNCLGALRFYNRDVDGAMSEWQRGLQIARASSTSQYEWSYCHNLAIASLSREDVEHTGEMLRRCERSLEAFALCFGKISAIEPALRALRGKLTSSWPGNVDALVLPSRAYSGITLSGSMLRLLHTRRMLQELGYSAINMDWLLPEVQRLPVNNRLLTAECLGRQFFLAME